MSVISPVLKEYTVQPNDVVIKSISGPVNFYYYKPKIDVYLTKKANEYPLIILFGDKNTDKNNLCNPCSCVDATKCCYKISDPNFLKLLDALHLDDKYPVSFCYQSIEKNVKDNMMNEFNISVSSSNNQKIKWKRIGFDYRSIEKYFEPNLYRLLNALKQIYSLNDPQIKNKEKKRSSINFFQEMFILSVFKHIKTLKNFISLLYEDDQFTINKFTDELFRFIESKDTNSLISKILLKNKTSVYGNIEVWKNIYLEIVQKENFGLEIVQKKNIKITSLKKLISKFETILDIDNDEYDVTVMDALIYITKLMDPLISIESLLNIIGIRDDKKNSSLSLCYSYINYVFNINKILESKYFRSKYYLVNKIEISGDDLSRCLKINFLLNITNDINSHIRLIKNPELLEGEAIEASSLLPPARASAAEAIPKPTIVYKYQIIQKGNIYEIYTERNPCAIFKIETKPTPHIYIEEIKMKDEQRKCILPFDFILDIIHIFAKQNKIKEIRLLDASNFEIGYTEEGRIFYEKFYLPYIYLYEKGKLFSLYQDGNRGFVPLNGESRIYKKINKFLSEGAARFRVDYPKLNLYKRGYELQTLTKKVMKGEKSLQRKIDKDVSTYKRDYDSFKEYIDDILYKEGIKLFKPGKLEGDILEFQTDFHQPYGRGPKLIVTDFVNKQIKTLDFSQIPSEPRVKLALPPPPIVKPVVKPAAAAAAAAAVPDQPKLISLDRLPKLVNKRTLNFAITKDIKLPDCLSDKVYAANMKFENEILNNKNIKIYLKNIGPNETTIEIDVKYEGFDDMAKYNKIIANFKLKKIRELGTGSFETVVNLYSIIGTDIYVSVKSVSRMEDFSSLDYQDFVKDSGVIALKNIRDSGIKHYYIMSYMNGTLKELGKIVNLNSPVHTALILYLIQEIMVQLKWLKDKKCYYFDIKRVNIMYRCTKDLISVHIIDLDSCDSVNYSDYPPPETIVYGSDNPRSIVKGIVEQNSDVLESYQSYMIGLTILSTIFTHENDENDKALEFINKLRWEPIIPSIKKDQILEKHNLSDFYVLSKSTIGLINGLIDNLSIDISIKNLLKVMIIGYIDKAEIRNQGGRPYLYIPRYGLDKQKSGGYLTDLTHYCY